MAGGLASGRGYSPMLPMTLGGEDLRTMSWMKLNDLYKAEEEEAWVNGFSKMVNAMYAKDTGSGKLRGWSEYEKDIQYFGEGAKWPIIVQFFSSYRSRRLPTR